MIIICINIRGLGEGTKRRHMRNIITKEGAEVVCIQETKTKTNSLSDATCFSEGK